MEFCSQVKNAYSRIKTLKAQGAENVALEAVAALSGQAQASKAKTSGGLVAELEKTAAFLASSRPTEPAMRNELSAIAGEARKNKKLAVGALKQMLSTSAGYYPPRIAKAREKISAYGAKLVPNGGRVFVHCHSTSVMAVLKRAWRDGKRFKVFCNESRPLFQGHISAKELSACGMPVTMIVDDAALFFLKQSAGKAGGGTKTVFFVGADAVTSRGELVNKIGSSMMAIAAREAGAKFYSCTLLHKYDSKTEGGKQEPIEFRDGNELLACAAKDEIGALSRVNIANPAFDATPPQFVTAYVTEAGVLAPKKAVEVARKMFRGRF
ncbi:MAG: S-methyl-5-thioribose-1-phosphate isomerase [Candidatus Micrarchaeia archaeon]|jgi:ribose 1,5-bisphosphate isomerase